MRQRVVEDPHFNFLRHLAQEMGVKIFLVGGLVRDLLLGRPTQDVDLILSQGALEAAKGFSRHTGGTYVLLREEGEMARVVINGQVFDFANFRGHTLEGDLKKRDFTINAIALSLAEAFSADEWNLFDPLKGINDLEAGIIKITSSDSFLRDPLRLLRAFRLSSQLGLSIESETRQALKNSASLLTRSAPERIHYEWLLLLSQISSFTSILGMEETGLLEILFPEMTALRKIRQDRYHHLDVFGHSLLTLQSLEMLMQKDTSVSTDLELEITSYLSQNQKAAWLKWAALLHDLGKAETAREKDGRLIFYGHAEASQRKLEMIAERFRLGKQELSFLCKLTGGHMRLFHLIQEEDRGPLTHRAINRFIREVSDELCGFFLLALADSLAAQGPEKPPDREDRIRKMWSQALVFKKEWLPPLPQKAPLLSGDDLIELGLAPGPSFKILLSEIQEEQWAGEIQTKEEALDWLKKRISL